MITRPAQGRVIAEHFACRAIPDSSAVWCWQPRIEVVPRRAPSRNPRACMSPRHAILPMRWKRTSIENLKRHHDDCWAGTPSSRDHASSRPLVIPSRVWPFFPRYSPPGLYDGRTTAPRDKTQLAEHAFHTQVRVRPDNRLSRPTFLSRQAAAAGTHTASSKFAAFGSARNR